MLCDPMRLLALLLVLGGCCKKQQVAPVGSLDPDTVGSPARNQPDEPVTATTRAAIPCSDAGPSPTLRPVADLATGQWRGLSQKNEWGIGGITANSLWAQLDEYQPDSGDSVVYDGGAQSSSFTVRLCDLAARPAPGAQIILSVTHRGDFEDANPGFAELRRDDVVLFRLDLRFGSVPLTTAEGSLPPDVVAEMIDLTGLSVRVRSKAGSPTNQDLSVVAHLSLRVSAVVGP